MRHTPPDNAEWRTSSFSQDGGECVEATWANGLAFVRDSKNRRGPVLSADLSALADAVKAGRVRR